ncbi:hypothetical protein [Nitrospira sp. Nam74]
MGGEEREDRFFHPVELDKNGKIVYSDQLDMLEKYIIRDADAIDERYVMTGVGDKIIQAIVDEWIESFPFSTRQHHVEQAVH